MLLLVSDISRPQPSGSQVGDFNLTILKPQAQDDREDANLFNPIWLVSAVVLGVACGCRSLLPHRALHVGLHHVGPIGS